MQLEPSEEATVMASMDSSLWHEPLLPSAHPSMVFGALDSPVVPRH